jgi:hypothetical protein
MICCRPVQSTTAKSNSHLADFVGGGVAVAPHRTGAKRKKKQNNNGGGVGIRGRLSPDEITHNAGEGGDVRRGGGGARGGGGGGGEAARRVAARAWPAPAAARRGALAAGAVALPAQGWRRRGGALHRARAVRGAGRAPQELRRLSRLQQASQGLLAPRVAVPRCLSSISVTSSLSPLIFVHQFETIVCWVS